MKICDQFDAFDRDPTVCDNCGNLFDEHDAGTKALALNTEYNEALMRTVIKLGGIHNYYGGLDRYKTQELQKHMENCRISWKDSSLPVITTVPEFNGTFDDSTYVEVIGARITCTCDRRSGYHYEEVVAMNLTMGQLIWHVVRHNDKNQGEEKNV